MKKAILLLFVVYAIVACQSNKKDTSTSGDTITVSILPQKTFIEKIAGNDFKINVLVPPGTSPEAGNLLPSQLKDIASSDVWFRIGHIGFEYSWNQKIREANPKMKIVDLSEGLDLISEKEEHGGHVHESGIDPHIWLSPVLVKQMAKQIYDELLILKPDKVEEYKINYLRFVKEIDLMHVEIKNKLKDYQGRKIIVFHPSLSYFAREYGLEQIPLESGGKEPSPQHMAKVVELAKTGNIKVIYIQSEFDRENARVFAEEIGGKIIQVSPLNPDWEENLKLMTQIFIDNF